MRTSSRFWISFFALLAFIAGCTGCATTAGYDPDFERDLTVLRDQVDAFLAQLETTAGTADGAYTRHEAFYAGLWVSFDALRQRAEASPVNGTTVTALAALGENLQRLESLHRQGLTKAEVPVLRKILCPQFDALCQLETAKGKG